MKKVNIKLMATTLMGTMMIFGFVNAANAQFSKAVVVLKGTVREDLSGKPHSVRVSVREISDTAREITSSRSNSANGDYLVVLKPGKKYWVHLEGENIITKDEMIETPAVIQSTQQIVKNFDIALAEPQKVEIVEAKSAN